MNARLAFTALLLLSLAMTGCKKEISETEKALTAGDLLLSPPKSDYVGAREQYAKAIAIDPGYDMAYLAMARAYEEEGDFKNAAKWYEKFTQVTKSQDMLERAQGWKQEAEHNMELASMSAAKEKEEAKPDRTVMEQIEAEKAKAVEAAVAKAKEEAQVALDEAKNQIKKLNQGQAELKDQIDLLNEQKEGLEKKLMAFKDSDDIADMLKTLESTDLGPELAQQVVKLKNDNTALATKVRTLDEGNARLREEVSTLKSYIKNGEASKEERAKLEEAESKYASLKGEKEALDAQLKELRAKTAQALSEAKNSEDGDKKAQALALTVADKQSEIAALKKTVEEKDAKIKTLESQQAALALPEGVAAKDISEEITSLRKDIATLQSQAKAKDTQIAYLRKELNKENGGVTRSEADIIKRQNAELHQQLDAATVAVRDEQAKVAEVKKQMDAQTEALKKVPAMASENEPGAITPVVADNAFQSQPAKVDSFAGVAQAQTGTAAQTRPVAQATAAAQSGQARIVSPTTKTQAYRPVQQGAATAQTAKAGSPKVYQVRRGDTLYSISKKFYGDSQQWRKILYYNKDQLRNSSALKVGQTLYIPQ